MLNIDHLVEPKWLRAAKALVRSVVRLLIVGASVLALSMTGCGSADTPAAPIATQTAAIPADAGTVDFGPFCNTSLPQNQTKFLSLVFPVDQSGVRCAASYGVSFGGRTFSCTCGDQITCQAAYAELVAQAQACPSAGW